MRKLKILYVVFIISVVFCMSCATKEIPDNEKVDELINKVSPSTEEREEINNVIEEAGDNAKVTLQEIADALVNETSEISAQAEQSIAEFAESEGCHEYEVVNYVGSTDKSMNYVCTVKIGDAYYAIICKDGKTYSLKDEYGVIADSMQ